MLLGKLDEDMERRQLHVHKVQSRPRTIPYRRSIPYSPPQKAGLDAPGPAQQLQPSVTRVGKEKSSLHKTMEKVGLSVRPYRSSSSRSERSLRVIHVAWLKRFLRPAAPPAAGLTCWCLLRQAELRRLTGWWLTGWLVLVVG